MNKSVSILLISIVSVLLLSSCSRGTVTTVDKSVEYKSAKSLPPLKKDREGFESEQKYQNNSQQTSVRAEIFKDKNEVSRLSVKSRFEDAWQYLDYQLNAANVTVYNRNESAGIFSVGCGDVADIPEFKKKGGFRILKRKKRTTETEYCILQVDSARRKTTTVTFLNRYGKITGGSYVDDLFGRLSNN